MVCSLILILHSSHFACGSRFVFSSECFCRSSHFTTSNEDRHTGNLITVFSKTYTKLPFLKRKDSRSGSNRGPSAYQPSALPLGHTGSLMTVGLAVGKSCYTYISSGILEAADGIIIQQVTRVHLPPRHPTLTQLTQSLRLCYNSE